MARIVGEVLSAAGLTNVADGGNREVRACDLLLQRRDRDALPRRGAPARAEPEGGDVRPRAGDERAGDHRRALRGASRRGSTTSSSATTRTPTWWDTPDRFPPRCKAVETVDAVPGARGRRGGEATGARLLVTADHGNCEMMIDPATGGPHTAHTTNPVPFLVVDDGGRTRCATGGALCDVGPDDPRPARPRAARRDDGTRPARSPDDRASLSQCSTFRSRRVKACLFAVVALLAALARGGPGGITTRPTSPYARPRVPPGAHAAGRLRARAPRSGGRRAAERADDRGCATSSISPVRSPERATSSRTLVGDATSSIRRKPARHARRGHGVGRRLRRGRRARAGPHGTQELAPASCRSCARASASCRAAPKDDSSGFAFGTPFAFTFGGGLKFVPGGRVPAARGHHGPGVQAHLPGLVLSDRLRQHGGARRIPRRDRSTRITPR